VHRGPAGGHGFGLGSGEGARRLLGEAIEQLDTLDMRLWAAAARLREGELGGEGAAGAEAWMRGEGVVAPAKVARQLVPV